VAEKCGNVRGESIRLTTTNGYPRIWIEVPEAVELESVDGSCGYSSQLPVLECIYSAFSLAPGQSWPMELVLRALQPGPVTLRTSVIGLGNDYNSINDQASVTVTAH
jgi:hypothetical protein